MRLFAELSSFKVRLRKAGFSPLPLFRFLLILVSLPSLRGVGNKNSVIHFDWNGIGELPRFKKNNFFEHFLDLYITVNVVA